uniref:Uncharacterized protein n=1 Tax=Tanacetum cinerariifolium TaxID=118510 RepID=A0A6L2MG67_TANCI|nr:hypothetical protein [Tanacetum cinerariifolium]
MQYTRRYRIAQSSVLPPAADEAASPLRDFSQGEACPTDSGFIADQDRATIVKSSTLPYDLAPMVTSPAADEGSMQHTIPELTALCTSLQRQLSELTDKFQAQQVEINRLKEKVKQLEEREGVAAINSRDDAPIKGRIMDEGEAAIERVSDDIKEMETVLTSMDIATVLASGVVNVPTGIFSTATVVTPYKRRKGKEVMVESETPKKQKVQEQIDAQLQSMIDGLDINNETVAKYLEEYRQFSLELPMKRRIKLISDLVKYQDNYTKAKDFKGMTFEEVEAKFNSVCKQMEDFILMGLKEEAEKIKRKGINLEQESAKKQKSSEEITEKAKSPEEVTKEKIKEMMQLVPIEEVYVEALQVKHPIIDWEVHTEGQRAYWKITRLGGSLASYQFFTDLLKHLDRDDLNQLGSLVKETLGKRPATSDKEMKLWVELSRLYEPNVEDQLWTHSQNFMHAPAEWKL